MTCNEFRRVNGDAGTWRKMTRAEHAASWVHSLVCESCADWFDRYWQQRIAAGADVVPYGEIRARINDTMADPECRQMILAAGVKIH